MNKQDFVVTELEAIGKDIEAIVKQERDLPTREEIDREERRAANPELGIPVPVRRYDPNKFIPELAYIETRLRAVQDYITALADAHIRI